MLDVSDLRTECVVGMGPGVAELHQVVGMGEAESVGQTRPILGTGIEGLSRYEPGLELLLVNSPEVG